MKQPSLLSLFGLALFGLASPAFSSDLTLDGQVALDLPYGNAFLIELDGNPDLPTLLYADFGPGPTTAFGESLPLDLSPALFLLLAGNTGASGTWAQAYPTPENPALSGLSVYLAGVVLDPADANGLDFSSGASLRFVPPVGAGADQAALVGRRVTLDGSDAAAADGSVPPGTSIVWSFASRPLGSVATISGEDTLFATFVPDVPGDYELEASVVAGGVSSAATSFVHAFELTLSPPIDGRYFPTGQVSVAGQLTGPGSPSLTLEGAPLVLGAGGSFGPQLLSMDTSGSMDGVLFGLAAEGGTELQSRRTVALGQPAWLAFGAPDSAVAHLETSGLAEVAAGIEVAFEQTDISVYLVDLPPALIDKTTGLFGETLFSAYIDFTSMTWNPDMQVTMVPTPSGVDAKVHLSNVTTYFDVWGKIIEIPYSLTGDSTSNGVDISAKLTLTTAGGDLKVNVSNVSVSLTGFSFDLNGFLGGLAQLFLIESWVEDQTVATMEAEIGNQIGPIVEGLLAGFELALDLSTDLELDAVVSTAFVGASHSSHGLTVQLDTAITVGAPTPGAPSVELYRVTPSLPPAFGTSTPTGQAYGGSLAASDDFLNLILAGLTRAGLLEGDLTELFPPDPLSTGPVLTTEVLAVLFPGAGFQLFPSGTAVDLRSHGVMPPVVVTTPGGPGLARLDLFGLEVSLEVAGASGAVPILTLVLDGSADLNLQAEGDGTLSAVLLGSNFTPTVLSGFPGSTIPSLQAGSDFLVQLLLPQLTEALGVIPVPSLDQEGITLTTDEVGLFGLGQEFMGFWGGMTYSPPLP